MSVYVDPAVNPFRGMLMCHMLADTVEELHEMAVELGLRRSWFQGDHYDVSKGKRDKAIKLGALEVTSREIVKVRRRWWEKYAPNSKQAKMARILDEIESELET